MLRRPYACLARSTRPWRCAAVEAARRLEAEPTRGGRGTLWEQVTLPRLLTRARADVLFAPGYSGPLLGSTPMVVTVHDVSFAAHPEWFAPREGLRRRTLTKLRLLRLIALPHCHHVRVLDICALERLAEGAGHDV